MSAHRGLPGHGSNRGPPGEGEAVWLAEGFAVELAGGMAADVAEVTVDAGDDRTPMSRTVSAQPETTSASAKSNVSGRTFTAYPWTTTLPPRRCWPLTRSGQATSCRRSLAAAVLLLVEREDA